MKSQIFNAPRIMIASPSSSSGKTTISCALLSLLKEKGRSPVSFKCGPDFIDPMFHRNVMGLASTNLDSYFCGQDQLCQTFADFYSSAKADCAVIEGVMGLFDGLAGKSVRASAYDIARITKTPILLLIDASGASLSLIPLIKGFLDYDRANSHDGENLIKGIFLNKASKSLFQLLKPVIEEECGVKVLGFFSKDCENVWKSRHLGLILPSEMEDLGSQIQKSGKILSENLDLPELEKIMKDAPALEFSEKEKLTGLSFICEKRERKLRIALARDSSFCFYYQENLKLLEELGADLIPFSPLHDKSLPENIQGIILGGGYPELYGKELEANSSMRESIKSAAERGLPLIAECGGFIYLHESFTDQTGSSYKMCGVLKGDCSYTGKLVRFGYAEFTPKEEAFSRLKKLFPDLSGDFSVKGHEFHYFDSCENGSAFIARKPLSKRSWDCMIFTDTMLAGFPHLYYPSNPEIALWFLNGCKKV
ncbi:MAG: cobyrinate a,c-diamide synthase [Treponema sp.]|nr:cobyrinate a,c-diamide synthase [Treponema sp.]